MNHAELAVSGQGGHNTTFRIACVLINAFALSREAALQFLMLYNKRCKPQWSQHELEHKIDDAMAAATHQRPRGYLFAAGAVAKIEADFYACTEQKCCQNRL